MTGRDRVPDGRPFPLGLQTCPEESFRFAS